MNLDDLTGRIICADCLDVLKQLPDKCVDLVLTDPPYLIKNTTAGVSDSQRYKMLGNGWTVDVIAHLLKGLK